MNHARLGERERKGEPKTLLAALNRHHHKRQLSVEAIRDYANTIPILGVVFG